MLKCIFCYLTAFSFLFLCNFSFGESCDPYSIYFYDRTDASWADDVTFANDPKKTIGKVACHCASQSATEIKRAVDTEHTPLEVKVCKLSKTISGIPAKEALDVCSKSCSEFPKMQNPVLF